MLIENTHSSMLEHHFLEHPWLENTTRTKLKQYRYLHNVRNKEERKRKHKTGNYIFIYSGVDQHNRAQAGVDSMIRRKYEENIEEIQYISERLLHTSIQLDQRSHPISCIGTEISVNPNKREKPFFDDLT